MSTGKEKREDSLPAKLRMARSWNRLRFSRLSCHVRKYGTSWPGWRWNCSRYFYSGTAPTWVHIRLKRDRDRGDVMTTHDEGSDYYCRGVDVSATYGRYARLPTAVSGPIYEVRHRSSGVGFFAGAKHRHFCLDTRRESSAMLARLYLLEWGTCEI